MDWFLYDNGLRLERVNILWSRGVLVITTTTQLHSIKPELRFCTGLYPSRKVLE